MGKGFRRFWGACALVFVFAGAAWANLVYTVLDDNYSSGSLGTLDGAALTSSPQRVSIAHNDPAVFAFEKDGTSHVLLAERGWGKSDRVSLYVPSVGWSRPLFNENWAPVENTHGVAVGDALYVASHNNGKIVKVALEDLKPLTDAYAPAPVAGHTTLATKVLFVDGHVYALFAFRGGEYLNFHYRPSKLVKLDTRLNFLSEVEVEENAVDMVYSAHHRALFVASWGGDFYGANGKIERYDLAGGTVSPFVDASSLGGGGIVSLSVGSGDALYFILQKYADASLWEAQNTLRKAAAGTVSLLKDVSASTGFSFRAAWDGRDKTLWVLRGDRILALDSEGVLKKTFTNVELGGNPYSIAVTGPGGEPVETEEEGGGGCNAGPWGIALLPVSLFLGKLGKLGRFGAKARRSEDGTDR